MTATSTSATPHKSAIFDTTTPQHQPPIRQKTANFRHFQSTHRTNQNTNANPPTKAPNDTTSKTYIFYQIDSGRCERINICLGDFRPLRIDWNLTTQRPKEPQQNKEKSFVQPMGVKFAQQRDTKIIGIQLFMLYIAIHFVSPQERPKYNRTKPRKIIGLILIRPFIPHIKNQTIHNISYAPFGFC